jgi:hypothetical protein
MAYAETRTRQEVTVAHEAVRDVMSSGAISGVAGGSVMALFSMGVCALTGYGFLFPFKVVGASFVGAEALVGGGGVVLYGLLLHLAISVAGGLLFAAVARRTAATTAGAVVGGMAYGLLTVLLMTYVVLPMVNPTMHERVVLMPGTWFTHHVLYGLGLALAWISSRSVSAKVR